MKKRLSLSNPMVWFVFCILVCINIFTRGVKAEHNNAFVFADDKEIMSVYYDPEAPDSDGMALVAETFTEDIERITGKKPELITDSSLLKGSIVIMGSIGNNKLIDHMISSKTLDVSEIKDKWECYKIQVIDAPLPGVDQAIVVVGSDKRGAFYGIFHISELLGISPWYYWADVAPKQRTTLTLTASELEMTSKEPSVKYRGIFLNDEAPSLSSWVSKSFGNYNEKFYKHVFELILRLKGNYMWPAMWSNSFSTDGDSSLIANAELADRYGIVMGTSHHEPMCRAGVEWKRVYSNYGTNGNWDFASNTEAISAFWDDGIKRNKDFENVITLGMRGEADSALGGSMEYNINLLKDIITTQKKILKQNNISDAPKVLTVYKEVEKYWNGDDKTEGLKGWKGLDDVTIMLCEDNFGNLRTLPEKKERDRKAGWGMYYHVDYHGGPKSYEWICTTPVEKIAEQMSMAYDYGVQEIWILNVGDLKPMEADISYFLDLAYDYDTYQINGTKGVKGYLRDFAIQQFGAYCDEDTTNEIADIMDTYLHMNGNRKPETINSYTYSVTNDNEAQLMLKKCEDLISRCDAIKEKLPAECMDTFYELAYYPAVATANVNEMWIFASFNELYSQYNSALANVYAMLTSKCITRDKELQNYYNKTMAAGKWDGMMSSNHVGYVTWNDAGWNYPQTATISLEKKSKLLIDLEGDANLYSEGEASLQSFHNLKQETYAITLSNGGQTKFDYTITPDCNWLEFSSLAGTVETGESIFVSVDWSKLTETTQGYFTVSGADTTIKILVEAVVKETSGITPGTFVGTDGIISVECANAENFIAGSKDETWMVIENYGKSMGDIASVKMFPTTASFQNPLKAPCLEYRILIEEDGLYHLKMYTAPTNNLTSEVQLRYAVAADEMEPVVASAIPYNYEAGGNSNGPWCTAVTNNILVSDTKLELKKGEHIIKIYGVDAGIVLQKFILSQDKPKSSYFGPEQSYRVGENIQKREGYHYSVGELKLSYLPGVIEVLSEEYCNSYSFAAQLDEKNDYIIRLYGMIDCASVSAVAKIDGEACGMQTWKDDIYSIELTSQVLKKLDAGPHVIEVTINNGNARLFALSLQEKSLDVAQEKEQYLQLITKAIEYEQQAEPSDTDVNEEPADDEQLNKHEYNQDEKTSQEENQSFWVFEIIAIICVVIALISIGFVMYRKKKKG